MLLAKKTIVVILMLFFALMFSFSSSAKELVDIDKSVENLKKSLSDEVQQDLKKIGADSYDISSFDDVSFKSILSLVFDKVENEGTTPLKSGVVVISILILTALLESYRDSLRHTSMQEVLSVVATLCIVTSLAFPVINLIRTSVATITDASNFMLLYIPIMIAILSLSGHAVSGASYYSLMLMVCEGVAQLSTKFIAPMLNVYLGFCVSSSICDRVNLKSFCDMISKTIKWLISFLMTVFSALLTIKGMISTAYDSVTARAVRFTMSSFIPIVGAALAESYKTIQGSINLIRTGAGVFVILAILVVFMPTIISCICWIFSLNLCKSVGETIGVTSPLNILGTVSSVVSTVLAITVCIMALFVISTALLITLSGGAV